MPKTLLLVDDEPISLDVIDGILNTEFSTRVATDGRSALALTRHEPLPDMILLDVSMPGMDGYEICSQLKRDPHTCDIPVLFISAHDDDEDVERGLELGAVDYLRKPVIPSILLARVRNHLRLREARALLADQNRHLEQLVHERTEELHDRAAELMRAQDLTIVALGTVAETRDNETGNHIFRTQAYVKALVEHLAATSYFDRNGDAGDASRIWKSAPLHDIGKVGIPDCILLKPGRLTRDEFEIMKTHTELGRKALLTAEARVSLHHSFLGAAIEIAYCHHERWDGRGYPEGVGGASIPVSARLMAVADVYDALISRRIYKSPVTHADALAAIRSERGRQLDPDLVDCFLDIEAEFRDIAMRFNDGDELFRHGTETEMEAFPWKDDYCVGDAVIDTQHKYMFSLASELVASKDKAEMTGNAVKLFRYVREHFHHEENLMRRLRYPGHAEHVAMHDQLISRLSAISGEIHRGEWSAATVREFMEHWVLDHILVQDTKLTSFLKSTADAA